MVFVRRACIIQILKRFRFRSREYNEWPRIQTLLFSIPHRDVQQVREKGPADSFTWEIERGLTSDTYCPLQASESHQYELLVAHNLSRLGIRQAA